MEERKVTDLSDAELIKELAFVNKQNKFYYARKTEIEKEIERRANND